MKFGSMSIAAVGAKNTYKKQWSHGQWTDNAQDFWDDFTGGWHSGRYADY